MYQVLGKIYPKTQNWEAASGTAHRWLLRTPQGCPFCIGPQSPWDSQEGERGSLCPSLGTRVLRVSARVPVQGLGGQPARHRLPRRTSGRWDAPSPSTGVQRRSTEVGLLTRRGVPEYALEQKNEAPIQRLQKLQEERSEKHKPESPERDLRFDYTSQCCDAYRKSWWRSATWGDPQKLHCRPTTYVTCK